MYKGKRVLAFIPARAGSKRLINKNKLIINRQPLFKYSVDVAKESKYIDKIIVSTDSQEIHDLAIKYGCINNNLRPSYLSDDKARIIDAILYEIKENSLEDYDAIVLLQPTFPIRTKELLDKAIELYFEKETSLITIVKVKEQPLMMRKIVNGELENIVSQSSDIRSQDFPEIYKIIGCIYINNLKTIDSTTVLNENKIPYLIDNKFDIDIDTIDDFNRAKEVLEK